MSSPQDPLSHLVLLLRFMLLGAIVTEQHMLWVHERRLVRHIAPTKSVPRVSLSDTCLTHLEYKVTVYVYWRESIVIYVRAITCETHSMPSTTVSVKTTRMAHGFCCPWRRNMQIHRLCYAIFSLQHRTTMLASDTMHVVVVRVPWLAD